MPQRCLVIALLAVLVGGCRADAADGSRSPEPADPAALDQTVRADAGKLVTLHQVALPVAPAGPQPGDVGLAAGWVWAALEVEVCAAAAADHPVRVERGSWVLRYPDERRIEPTRTADPAHPEPAFPWEGALLEAGACVRGWITYAVPPDAQPAEVLFTSGGRATARWAV